MNWRREGEEGEERDDLKEKEGREEQEKKNEGLERGRSEYEGAVGRRWERGGGERNKEIQICWKYLWSVWLGRRGGEGGK